MVLQPFAVIHDIGHGLVGVPGQLADAGGHVKQAFQAESPTAAAYELTEAVEKTASAAETTLAAGLLARGGAKIIQESRAGGTKVAPVETSAPARPLNDYDAAAWDAYYRVHPEEMRSVGAAGARSYEVLGEAPVTGTTRGSHRRSALKDLERQLEEDPVLRQAMDEALGAETLGHMRSGKSGLKNPPGTELHHPKDAPSKVEVLKKETHRSPDLQEELHSDNVGGFATHYGKRE